MFHIVDDDKIIREVMEGLLGIIGYESKSFGCPKEYLQYAESNDFTMPYAVLTDVQMPKMNGYEMLEQLRQTHPAIRTAVISGYPKFEDGTKTACCAFLHKPIVMEEFQHVIRSFVECCENGPDADKYGCGSPERCEDFNVEEWHCPHGGRCAY